MSNIKEEEKLPNVNVEVFSQLNEIYMKSRVTQEFQNKLKSPIELRVLIPNNIPEIIFSFFSAKIGDSKVVKSKVIKDEKAQEKYNDAIASGNAAIFVRKSPNGEKYIVNFGNIPPNEKVIFTSEFIQYTRYKEKIECEIFKNLPIFQGLINYHNVNLKGKLEIKTQNKIIDIEKKIETKNLEIIEEKYLNNEHTNYIIIYTIKKLPRFRTIYEEYIPPTKILVNTEYKQPIIYSQKLANNSDEKIYSLLYKSKIIDNTDKDLELNPGLFIFLLDQSGSMKGKAIKIACNALKIFLQSIPKNSYYQIIGFGTKYKKYNEKPVKYIKTNIERSLKKIDSLKADMRGTNIFSPLEDIYKTEEIEETKKLPKAIFLLTDGEIKNKEKTLKLIESNNNRYSIYSIGVGNNFDKDLIKNAGIIGKGNYNFCSDFKNLTTIISKNINEFLTSCHNYLTNITNLNVTSSLKEENIIKKDEIPKSFDENIKININYLIKEKNNNDKIKVYVEYNIGKDRQKEEYEIVPKEFEEGNELFKLAYKTYISNKENSLRNLIPYKKEKTEEEKNIEDEEQTLQDFLEPNDHSENNQTLEEYNESVRKENEFIKKENELIEKQNAPVVTEIIDICLKYQILSKLTTLFAKVELDNKITEEMKEIHGFYNQNDILIEFNNLNEIIEDNNIAYEKKLIAYDKFYDEYGDDIETLPENKINKLNYFDDYLACNNPNDMIEDKSLELIKIKEATKGFAIEDLEEMKEVNEERYIFNGFCDIFDEGEEKDKKIKEKEIKKMKNKMKLKESINLKKSLKNKEVNKDKVMEIIKTQDFLDGFWDVNNKTESIKKKYKKEFDLLLGLKKQNNKINEKVVMTVLIIYYVNNEYPELIEEILMIIKKGKLFIKKTSNESYENIIKMANIN